MFVVVLRLEEMEEATVAHAIVVTSSLTLQGVETTSADFALVSVLIGRRLRCTLSLILPHPKS
jgi:hypothetical protein